MSLLWDTIESELPTAAGKRIGRSVWLHASALGSRLRADVGSAAPQTHDVPEGELVLRVDRADRRVALLHYPRFLELAHPALCCSTLVYVDTGAVAVRSFAEQGNRPILHRKELLVLPTHPAYNQFSALTQAEERLGLLEEKRRIGWSQYWDRLLAERRIVIEGHHIREF